MGIIGAMKHGHSLAVALLALTLSACGGGGGGSSSTGSPVGLTGTPRVEAVLTDTSLDPNFSYQDPLNLQTGDGVTFQLVSYSSSGERTVLAPDGWRTTDTNSTYGILASNGVFTAGNSAMPTGSKYIVTATFGGRDYSSYYVINPRQVRLRGKVLAEADSADQSVNPVYGLTVNFYGPRNPDDPSSATVIVATVHTAVDGTFRASIPSSATGFSIDPASVPGPYYASFRYLGARYDAGSTFCMPTFPVPFADGDRTLLDSENSDPTTNGTILLTPKTLFPDGKPDPDGCSAP